MSQYDNYSIAELEKARAEIDDLILKRKAEAKSALLVEFKQKAKDLGIDFNELLGTKNTKSAPKYRNPEKPSETWSGRGKPSKWLKEKLDAGRKIEEFEV